MLNWNLLKNLKQIGWKLPKSTSKRSTHILKSCHIHENINHRIKALKAVDVCIFTHTRIQIRMMCTCVCELFYFWSAGSVQLLAANTRPSAAVLYKPKSLTSKQQLTLRPSAVLFGLLCVCLCQNESPSIHPNTREGHAHLPSTQYHT